MGWFDPPAIALRKRIPATALSGFNSVEDFALFHLDHSQPQHKPYQLGVVLALWIKAGELNGAIQLGRGDSRKVQAIYVSSMNVLMQESLDCFHILTAIAEQGGTFGVPADFYRELAANVAS